MRHRKRASQLNRTSTHRRAMFRNMAAALIQYERIETTLPKAKGLRKFLEPLVTRAKDSTDHNRRIISARLGLHFNPQLDKDHKQGDRATYLKIFEVGQRMKERPGGYT